MYIFIYEDKYCCRERERKREYIFNLKSYIFNSNNTMTCGIIVFAENSNTVRFFYRHVEKFSSKPCTISSQVFL